MAETLDAEKVATAWAEARPRIIQQLMRWCVDGYVDMRKVEACLDGMKWDPTRPDYMETLQYFEPPHGWAYGVTYGYSVRYPGERRAKREAFGGMLWHWVRDGFFVVEVNVTLEKTK